MATGQRDVSLAFRLLPHNSAGWANWTCIAEARSFCRIDRPADKDYTIHRLVLGTHTSGNDKNHLHIASVHLPKPTSTSSVRDTTATVPPLESDKYDPVRGEIGEYNDTTPRIKITQSILHDGEVNRARYMPQNVDLIATKTPKGQVLVFDRTKHPSTPKPGDDKCKPDITLRGHSKEG